MLFDARTAHCFLGFNVVGLRIGENGRRRLGDVRVMLTVHWFIRYP